MNNVLERIAQHVFDAFKLLEYIYTPYMRELHNKYVIQSML